MSDTKPANTATPDLGFLSLHPFVPAVVQDKIKGTIVGSALGDCIGLYTEFLSSELAREAYPDGKFRLANPATKFRNDGHRNKFEIGSWTDDTDHALMILLSFLHHDGETLSANDLAHRLLIWVEQGLRALNRPPLGLGRTVGSVNGFPQQNPPEFVDKSGRKVAPNGSLMRTHPLGIICVGYSFEETCRIATDFSLVTHADPRCVVACCIATGLVRGILRGEILAEVDVDNMIERVYGWVDRWTRSRQTEPKDLESNDTSEFEGGELLDQQEFSKHVQAQTFEELQLDDSMKIGYVYKCLGAAILSLRMAMRRAPFNTVVAGKHTDTLPSAIFESIITELTLAAGDADTNACVAGAFLGCWFGYNALPPHWRDGMQHFDWLTHKCNGLIEILQISREPESKYKGKEDPDTRPDGGKGLMDREELQKRDCHFMLRYMAKHSEGAEEEKARLKQEKKPKQKRWTGIFGGKFKE
ncbi:conserved hypothetical protein [Uncinocarpus reesii 1704]|uniref:ADP-ribosylglycohydrolase n=1 Tax=Uncinocarpus reesii (strain UAMH 1704) TaxID=336963 RepID=C4JEU1_UNCRE|nr:uncharacterized protein UREG_02251 [Uncinocarpus reesii 1704]EEP77402.1 conserved hypothetical protein [Uncinocarpus reesii 1704]